MSFNTDEKASCSQSELQKTCTREQCENTSKLWCENDKNSPILFLNDYCLHGISEMLPISDKINFAFACSRFFNVMKSISTLQQRYQTTRTFIDWSTQKLKHYFAIFGTQIKHLKIVNVPLQESLYDLIPWCQNIVELDLYCDFLDTNGIIKLILHMENIEIVNIHGCSKIDDYLLQYFERFKSLKSLTITDNVKLTGKGIELLRGLETLSISFCPSITTECFINICANLNNLRHLDVIDGDFSKPGNCKIIAKNLLKLETLKINCHNDDIDFLMELTKLKKLHIKLGSNSSEEIFRNFLLLNVNQLEELHLVSTTTSKKILSAITECKKLKALHITCWEITDEIIFLISTLTEIKDLSLDDCKRITDDCVLEIFKKCLKLQFLNLECCDSLTTTLFENAITVLQRQHAEYRRSSHISITGTFRLSNNEFLEKLPMFNTYTDLFRIYIKPKDEYDYDGAALDEEYNLNWE